MTRRILGTVALFLLAATVVWATGTTESSDPDGPIEIEYFTHGGSSLANAIRDNEDFVAAAILEKLNVVIKPELPDWNDQPAVLTARIAAADYPDWMYLRDDSLYQELLEDDIIVNLSPNIERLELPDLARHLEIPTADIFREPDGWYGIPVYFGYSRNGLYYRKDWADELGLALPKTLDEYREFLQAMVDADPDGLGTTGITTFNPQNWLVNHIGVTFWGYSDWLRENGRWRFHAIEESYRDFLHYVQDLAEAGLIDPDAVTQPRAQALEKFQSGRAAAFYLSIAAFDGIERTLKQLNPSAEVGLMTPPPAGPAGAFNDSLAPMRYRNAASFEAGDAKVDGFLRVLDWVSSAEGTEVALWGIEGVDYVIQADGSRLRLPIDPPGSRLFGDQGYYLFANQRVGDSVGSRPNAEVSRFIEWTIQNSVVNDVQAFGPPRYRELEVITNEIVTRYFLESTFNSLDIDDTWDAYVREVREAGIDEMMTILSTEYRAWR